LLYKVVALTVSRDPSAHFYFWPGLFLAIGTGVICGLMPLFIIRVLGLAVVRGRWDDPFNMLTGGFYAHIPFTAGYILLLAVMKPTANWFIVEFIVKARVVMSEHWMKLYMDPLGRTYYIMNNLDKRIDSADGRLTNDIDLMLQFSTEFVLGGVIGPESGALVYTFQFLTAMSVGTYFVGWKAFVVDIIVFLVFLAPTRWVGNAVEEGLHDIQGFEAKFRQSHNSVAGNSEATAFYGGEKTEKRVLDNDFSFVENGFHSFVRARLPMDTLQLLLNFGTYFIAGSVAAPVVYFLDDEEQRKTMFIPLFMTYLSALIALLSISKVALDYFKAEAYTRRVLKMLEVMEEFYVLSAHRAKVIKNVDNDPLLQFDHIASTDHDFHLLDHILTNHDHGVKALECAELVPTESDQTVRFVDCSIYTPDGMRLLIPKISLELDAGEGCLIMGPSGIGKSSLLKCLGELWPLFRHPEDLTTKKARFFRPGNRNVFFLPQKPYLFAGSLREQVAYPQWDETCLTELTDEVLERLFTAADLASVWDTKKAELDTQGISWGSVMSIGEQQRLQFCRLWWHVEWVRKKVNTNPFYAILDESTACLSSESEIACYKHCKEIGIGFLSVAHRPTVIQFHEKVVHFFFDKQDKIQFEIVKSSEMAETAATMVTEFKMAGPKKTEVPDEVQRARAKSIFAGGGPDLQSLSTPAPRTSFLQSQDFQPVKSPYAAPPGGWQRGWFEDLFLTWRIVSRSWSTEASCLFFVYFCTVTTAAAFEALWVMDFVELTITSYGDNEHLMWMAVVTTGLLGVGKALMKVASNYLSMLLMVCMRKKFTLSAHEIYMSPASRCYYALNNLDSSCPKIDQRLTNDVDLLFQYLAEFLFGGVIKMECGLFFTLTSAIFCGLLSYYGPPEHWAAGLTNGIAAPFAPLVVPACCIPFIFFFASIVTSEQVKVQIAEADLRVKHAACKQNSESVCFYGGETTVYADFKKSLDPIKKAWQHYNVRKIGLDFFICIQFFSIWPLPFVIGGIMAHAQDADRIRVFAACVGAITPLVRNVELVSLGALDMAKCSAFLQRAADACDAMDRLDKHAKKMNGEKAKSRTCCGCFPVTVPELQSGDQVKKEMSKSIELSKVTVYTPDGLRCLIPQLDLSLKTGDRVLIIGPSGCGKSSILRMVGELWPIFKHPRDVSGVATFARPGPRNVFILPQRPYIFSGTLREQISYPVWEPSLDNDLNNTEMERLFADACLDQVWKARRSQLDETGVDWSSVLSLGEQQRVQFARLFWHAEFHKKCGDGNPFFCMLDESTASVDVEGEMNVYKKLVEMGVGFLSIAQRPTVIQFHTKVLRFYYDEKDVLKYELTAADKMAAKVGDLIRGTGTM
jgi:ABC-type uncharacterized transport system fused permease/ATPase subunit